MSPALPLPPTGRAASQNAVAIALALLAGLLAMRLLGPAVPARDLMALWLAAEEVAAGAPDHIYPPLGTLFTMRPAMDWYDRAAALGRAGQVYPYLYPPLWAELLAPLTRLTRFETFATAMLGLNAALLTLLPFLALRFADRGAMTGRSMIGWGAGALAVMALCHGMPIALFQGQPQIIVAFLTLFALDRAAKGHAALAGGAMGLAVALKLSPLPLVLLWCLAGQARAGIIALATAGALALVSLGTMGWPLHQAFLAQLHLIDGTAFSSKAVASFDQLIGSLCCGDRALRVPDLPPEIGPSAHGWYVLAKSAVWNQGQKLAMLLVLAFFAVALRSRRPPAQQAALWAAAIASFAFLGPIGWLYYYLVPLALLPLVWTGGGRVGRVLAVASIVSLEVAHSVALPSALGTFSNIGVSLSVPILIAAFLTVAFRQAEESAQSGLRPAVT